MTTQPNQDAMGELRDEVATLLHGDYGCTRVWEAWQYGTMTEEDFVPLEDTERVDEIVALAEAYAQRRVEEVIQWLEDDIKRIDSRNWDMESLVIEHLVRANEATDDQKRSHNDIVTDRRAALLLYAVLNNYKKLNQTTEDKT